MGANGWRVMWLMVVYDCPMTDQKAVHDYTVFRRHLLELNFMQIQYSVYIRHFPTFETAKSTTNKLKTWIPDNASVLCFMFTDKQYGMTQEFVGRVIVHDIPDEPEQIQLFE